jgi:dTDP-4-amino-4,6-dideoxygalactose transaminase
MSVSAADRHTSASVVLETYDEVGFNYRMTDLQGALGSAQMDRIDWILGERARQAALYGQALAGADWLRTPAVTAGETHGWQAYVCLYEPAEPTVGNVAQLRGRRDRLMASLEAEGISTRPGTHAPVNSALYRARYGLRAEQFPGATLAESLSLALPLFAGLADGELARVAEAVLRLGP